MSVVVAVTIETHPDIEGTADGADDVGNFEGITLGILVVAAVRKATQQMHKMLQIQEDLIFFNLNEYKCAITL